MRKIVTSAYAIIAVTIALVTTILECQPALFWIRATSIHGEFFPKIVMLLTALTLLTPLIILYAVLILIRIGREDDPDQGLPGTTGIWITHKSKVQSAFLGIPVFVNGVKVGMMYNEKTRFFEIGPGAGILQAGKLSADKTEFDLGVEKHLRYELTVVESRFKIKYVLVSLGEGRPGESL
jgi:hypothetical protein